jgi:outer membrane lipoprotein-sorting protein
MRRNFPSHIAAVIVQRDPSDDSLSQTVRVERAKDGRSHHVVLQPLRLQGMESVDNGRHMHMYWPDKNLVIVQVSPHQMSDDSKRRIGWVKQNYRLSFGEATRIAGRTAKVVIAVAKDSRLGERRFYLDQSTSYPLRMEVIEDGLRRVIYDTKEIRFPESLVDERFEMRPLGAARKVTYDAPEQLTKSGVKRRLGFSAMIPGKLPMGFKVQDMQLTESDKWRALAIRITDGLIKATVYQWRSKEDVSVRVLENSSLGVKDDLNVLVVADLAPDLRKEILRAYVPNAGLTSAGPVPATWSQDFGPTTWRWTSDWEPNPPAQQLLQLPLIKSNSGTED